MSYCVYILTNQRHTVLYIGVTNDLSRRLWEHQHHFARSFSYQYNLEKLVWYEQYDSIKEAIRREKQLKHWNRSWKEKLISEMNQSWKDLSTDLFQ